MWFRLLVRRLQREKWKAKELIEMVHTYQPDILLDNRLTINEGTKNKWADDQCLRGF